MAGARQAVAQAHRIVVKVGSSSLTTAAGGLDADRVDALVDVLAKHRMQGVARRASFEGGCGSRAGVRGRVVSVSAHVLVTTTPAPT